MYHVSLKSSKRLAAGQNYRAWLYPSTCTCNGQCSSTVFLPYHSASTVTSRKYNAVWEVLRPPFKMCFCHTTGRIYLCTKLDGNLFNLSCLKAKTKVCKMLIMDMLFAEDCPQLQYKDVQKKDIKAIDTDTILGRPHSRPIEVEGHPD